MAHNNKDKTGKALRMANVIAGTRKHFTNGSEAITLDGARTTIDEVMNDLQAFIDERAAIVAAQTEVRNKVAAERASPHASPPSPPSPRPSSAPALSGPRSRSPPARASALRARS